MKDALEDLNAYLANNQADLEAWQYLANVYIENQLYNKAMYCYEELLATYQQNYYLFLVYAELLCTEGKKDSRKTMGNYLLARKYAAHAVILNPTSPRALWCLYHICKTCARSKQDSTTNADLTKVATDGLKKVYEHSPVKAIALENAK